ncbi:hypothetical protein M422DRAFT_254130 [Sphaerobolus stellatus SS14]|uniref:Unplaced genomic scaffold SPHSTscaffold_53, whole genome shotgun sequence n=1 Tax=Sphaerobolus stellatus (strain SS14) TaxID=990650 RepID=A0A0C9VVK1_SPHS4|nr:hypothetical protein M422DRAFT_254130 [Sphaerobolus stellatus SS14]
MQHPADITSSYPRNNVDLSLKHPSYPSLPSFFTARSPLQAHPPAQSSAAQALRTAVVLRYVPVQTSTSAYAFDLGTGFGVAVESEDAVAVENAVEDALVIAAGLEPEYVLGLGIEDALEEQPAHNKHYKDNAARLDWMSLMYEPDDTHIAPLPLPSTLNPR